MNTHNDEDQCNNLRHGPVHRLGEHSASMMMSQIHADESEHDVDRLEWDVIAGSAQRERDGTPVHGALRHKDATMQPRSYQELDCGSRLTLITRGPCLWERISPRRKSADSSVLVS